MKTGRSKNLTQRRSRHARDPRYRDYDFEPVRRTDNYAEQRGLEQVLHDRYKPPLDKIRAVDPNNPRASEYRDAARRYLEREKR